MARSPFAALLAAAACWVVAAEAEPAQATSQSTGPRAIAVSVPSDPVRAQPGAVAQIHIRIVNPNPTPTLVTVESRSLLLGDNGTVSIGAGRDPRWADRLELPRGVVRLPAEGWRDLRLAARVPDDLEPDLYFVGFLVTPVAQGGPAVKVVNQIGSFVTLDVPGPRVRRLVAHVSLPSFVLGARARGTLRVTNTGKAAASFWGEHDLTSWPGTTVAQERLDTYLLPAGRSRVLTVTAAPRWPVGVLRVTTRIVYPGVTESSTREITFTRRTIVVSPWVPVALAALVVAAVAAWSVHRWRRRPAGLVLERA